MSAYMLDTGLAAEATEVSDTCPNLTEYFWSSGRGEIKLVNVWKVLYERAEQETQSYSRVLGVGFSEK